MEVVHCCTEAQYTFSSAIRWAKLQSNHHHQQTNTQLFTVQTPFLSPNQQCQNTTTTMVNQTVVTFVVPELLPLKRYSLHVRVLMFKAFEMMHGSWLLHSV